LQLARSAGQACASLKNQTAAAFFVSDKNSYMSGATVVIDGAV
jgi:hypothetical protein